MSLTLGLAGGDIDTQVSVDCGNYVYMVQIRYLHLLEVL